LPKKTSSVTTATTRAKRSKREVEVPVKASTATVRRITRKISDDRVTPSKKRATKPVSYPCLIMTQNNHRFFLTSIPVSDLFSWSFVSSRAEDNIEGFQRQVSKTRADDISQYLNHGTGSIPTNVVLSAQEDAGLKYNSRSKTISFERLDKAFLVLDGQHRLWGYQTCLDRFKKDHRVPVSIYEKLTRAEEARLFIDINTKQVGVPAALLLDIQHLAEIEKERDTILRDLFDGLRKSPELRLSSFLSPAKSVAGKVSRVTFNRAVGQILESSVFLGLDAKKRFPLLLNYLTAFEQTLEDQSLLTRSAFLEAIFDVFEQAVRQSLLTYKNAKVDSLAKVIRPVAKYSYPDATLRSVGQLKKAVRGALAGSVTIAANML
jgi:DNA sulfur modification protein DndB